MLQKGHTTSEVADIAICGDGDECLLASVSKDGELFVWNIIYTESYEPARHSTISSFCSYACTFTFFTAIRHLTLVGAARAALRSPLWGCIRLLTVRSLRKSDAWSTGASCGTRSSGASRRRRPAVPAARREPWVRGEERRAGVAWHRVFHLTGRCAGCCASRGRSCRAWLYGAGAVPAQVPAPSPSTCAAVLSGRRRAMAAGAFAFPVCPTHSSESTGGGGGGGGGESRGGGAGAGGGVCRAGGRGGPGGYQRR